MWVILVVLVLFGAMVVGGILLYHYGVQEVHDHLVRWGLPSTFVKSLHASSKTLLLYAYTETPINRANLKFFCDHGLDEHVVTVLVCNGCTVPEFVPNFLRVLERPNTGFDFEAHFHGLAQVDDLNAFDYFLFLNASVRGPYLPRWFDRSSGFPHWSHCFTQFLSVTVKLVGTTLNHRYRTDVVPHVQSMVWCTDRQGLDILRDHHILEARNPYGKEDTIRFKEVHMSKLIKDQGFDFRSLALGDYLEVAHDDPQWLGTYHGTNLNPLECLFVKTNSNRLAADPVRLLYDRCFAARLGQT